MTDNSAELQLFLEDVLAQHRWAYDEFMKAQQEYLATPDGQSVSHVGRISMRNFATTVKRVLDQMAVRLWTLLVEPSLSETQVQNFKKNVYYPYPVEWQRFSAAMSKMGAPALDLPRLHHISHTLRPPEQFSACMACQMPFGQQFYRGVSAIGVLSRSGHAGLISVVRHASTLLVDEMGQKQVLEGMQFVQINYGDKVHVPNDEFMYHPPAEPYGPPHLLGTPFNEENFRPFIGPPFKQAQSFAFDCLIGGERANLIHGLPKTCKACSDIITALYEAIMLAHHHGRLWDFQQPEKSDQGA